MSAVRRCANAHRRDARRILGVIGIIRIAFGKIRGFDYGEHWFRRLHGWRSSHLWPLACRCPFILKEWVSTGKRVGAIQATLVDVTGLVIISIALVFLSGTPL